MDRDDNEPSSSAMIMWTVILMLIGTATVGFVCMLITHAALPRRVVGACLGCATALALIRWVMQKYER